MISSAIPNISRCHFQGGKMPVINLKKPLVVETRSGIKYSTGAGRLEWGEGFEYKMDPEAVKFAGKKSYRLSAKPKKK